MGISSRRAGMRLRGWLSWRPVAVKECEPMQHLAWTEGMIQPVPTSGPEDWVNPEDSSELY